jgi:hypothetical protein
LIFFLFVSVSLSLLSPPLKIENVQNRNTSPLYAPSKGGKCTVKMLTTSSNSSVEDVRK